MITRVLPVTAESLAEAARLLRAGEVVAFPTETVYGLGADAFNPRAVAKIFAAKGRPADNPLIVHVSRAEDARALWAAVSPEAETLMALFWPGPLTLILPKADGIPDETTAGLPTVAVRCPEHPDARALLAACARPIAAPSANRSGSPSPTTARDTLADMDGRIPLILDGGASRIGLESTVLSLAGETPVVLRPGGVTVEMLREAIGAVRVHESALRPLAANAAAPSPGMKYRHYAPRADVVLFSGAPERVCRALCARYDAASDTKPVILCFAEETAAFGARSVRVWGRRAKPEELAEHLFSALRALDEEDFGLILCPAVDTDGIGLAVMNRLCRAAGFHIEEV